MSAENSELSLSLERFLSLISLSPPQNVQSLSDGGAQKWEKMSEWTDSLSLVKPRMVCSLPSFSPYAWLVNAFVSSDVGEPAFVVNNSIQTEKKDV